MSFVEYNRKLAVEYARNWALSNNPRYTNYSSWGGDCTNYISQCVHEGGIPFDNSGGDILHRWYWYSDSNRTPSWTSAEAFGNYILNNNTKKLNNYGIYATLAKYEELEIGDLIQLVYSGKAYHTMIITDVILEKGKFVLDYLICQHSSNLKDYPLSEKIGDKRYIKIHGYNN